MEVCCTIFTCIGLFWLRRCVRLFALYIFCLGNGSAPLWPNTRLLFVNILKANTCEIFIRILSSLVFSSSFDDFCWEKSMVKVPHAYMLCQSNMLVFKAINNFAKYKKGHISGFIIMKFSPAMMPVLF